MDLGGIQSPSDTKARAGLPLQTETSPSDVCTAVVLIGVCESSSDLVSLGVALGAFAAGLYSLPSGAPASMIGPVQRSLADAGWRQAAQATLGDQRVQLLASAFLAACEKRVPRASSNPDDPVWIAEVRGVYEQDERLQMLADTLLGMLRFPREAASAATPAAPAAPAPSAPPAPPAPPTPTRSIPLHVELVFYTLFAVTNADRGITDAAWQDIHRAFGENFATCQRALADSNVRAVARVVVAYGRAKGSGDAAKHAFSRASEMPAAILMQVVGNVLAKCQTAPPTSLVREIVLYTVLALTNAARGLTDADWQHMSHALGGPIDRCQWALSDPTVRAVAGAIVACGRAKGDAGKFAYSSASYVPAELVLAAIAGALAQSQAPTASAPTTEAQPQPAQPPAAAELPATGLPVAELRPVATRPIVARRLPLAARPWRSTAARSGIVREPVPPVPPPPAASAPVPREAVPAAPPAASTPLPRKHAPPVAIQVPVPILVTVPTAVLVSATLTPAATPEIVPPLPPTRPPRSSSLRSTDGPLPRGRSPP
ncbi:hypothetical protein [Polyangium fumosum]|uniref:Uncharacterized protein n=1 Tax=Polyangium fumosum TaxID=889272 RepID=A0A4U1IUE3_9BACT|nr:hypothetical protein [Polyangium fumosum]TKC97996.1 hypothetical protein E8A74_43165 [Polyangium fumosum]